MLYEKGTRGTAMEIMTLTPVYLCFTPFLLEIFGMSKFYVHRFDNIVQKNKGVIILVNCVALPDSKRGLRCQVDITEVILEKTTNDG